MPCNAVQLCIICRPVLDSCMEELDKQLNKVSISVVYVHQQLLHDLSFINGTHVQSKCCCCRAGAAEGRDSTSEPFVYEYNQDYIDRRYEVMTLNIVHRRRRTGFEETKEFPIRTNDLIAGRYQVGYGHGFLSVGTVMASVWTTFLTSKSWLNSGTPCV